MNKAFLLYWKQTGPTFLILALLLSLLLFFVLSTIHSIVAGEAGWKKNAIISAVLLGAALICAFIYFSPYQPFFHAS